MYRQKWSVPQGMVSLVLIIKKKKKVSDRHSHLALEAEHYWDFLALYFPP